MEIEFSAHKDYYKLKDNFPTPIKFNIPEWYKKLPHGTKSHKHIFNRTIKGCMTIMETLTNGYLLKTPVDYHIRHGTQKDKNGKILYNQYCASCHQPNLAGAANWQGLDEDGHRKAPPLNGTGHTWHHTDELLHRMIEYGFAKQIKNYEGKMMGFGDKITDEGIDNILSYIKFYWKDDIYEYHLEMSK